MIEPPLVHVQFVGGDGGPTISQGTELATMLLSAACQIKAWTDELELNTAE